VSAAGERVREALRELSAANAERHSVTGDPLYLSDTPEEALAALARLEAVAEAASNPNLFDIDDRIAYGAQLELKAALRALDEEQA